MDMKTTSIRYNVYIIVTALSMISVTVAPASAIIAIGQTLSDGAQRNIIAFGGLGILTGSLVLSGLALVSYFDKKSLMRVNLDWSMWLLPTIIVFPAIWVLLRYEGFNPFPNIASYQITFTAFYIVMLTIGFGIPKESLDRKLQEALKEQTAILDALPTGLCILRDRVIEHCNPAMEKMFGFAPGTLTGRSMRCFHLPISLNRKSNSRY
jgi:PAS domain-containing protein